MTRRSFVQLLAQVLHIRLNQEGSSDRCMGLQHELLQVGNLRAATRLDLSSMSEKLLEQLVTTQDDLLSAP